MEVVGGGALHFEGNSCSIKNSIFWNNSASLGSQINISSATLNISYSNVDGDDAGIALGEYGDGTLNWLSGNINADPLFINSVTEDYHLQPNSPCIDTGTDSDTPTHDKDGNLRDNNPDMGAYEFYCELTPEICDGLDNDCDGIIPADETTDADGDGFVACNDCDDTDPAINPGAQEVCEGIDNNCDGHEDEDLVRT